jgi:ABC-2 type transport system ATP-binding protein
MADYIGIMAGGVLGYQNKFNQNDNLEELFMNIAGKYRREGE